jgi:hypothetical protein
VQQQPTGAATAKDPAGDWAFTIKWRGRWVHGTALAGFLPVKQKLVRRSRAERCRDPEDLANETVQRVIDALNKNPQRLTTKIEAFISGFATNIIYESRRSPIYKEDPLDDISQRRSRARSRSTSC